MALHWLKTKGARLIEFFTNTQSWQCWHYSQLWIKIYSQFSSLFEPIDVTKCENRNKTNFNTKCNLILSLTHRIYQG